MVCTTQNQDHEPMQAVRLSNTARRPIAGKSASEIRAPVVQLSDATSVPDSLVHPLISVGWSRFAAFGCACLLRAAISLAGRSFSIYESVHEREGGPKYRSRLIEKLAELLPDGCIPILVTDAGFRPRWTQALAYCARHSAKGCKHQEVTGTIAESKFSWQSTTRE